jgi:hypothetical protein
LFLGCKNFSGEVTDIFPWLLEEIKVTNEGVFGCILQDSDFLQVYPKNTISITLTDEVLLLAATQSTDIVSIHPGGN